MSHLKRLSSVAVGGLLMAAIGAEPVAACPGDCDGDGSISIAELVTGTNILLGLIPASRCAGLAADGAEVTVGDLVRAVRAALEGCSEPDPTPTVNVSEDLLISMEWWGCPGNPFDCPTYTVTVDANGEVVFDGKSGVAAVGIVVSNISSATLAQLIEAFEDADFFDLPCCRCETETILFDVPLSHITVERDAVRREALHDHGCWQSPDHPRMSQLETTLERLLDLCPLIGNVSFHTRCR